MAKTAEDEARNCATAWFLVLERARLTDNYELAARAEANLRRLGVEVRFRRQARRDHRKGARGVD